MIEVLTTDSPAQLRHEYATPVKHVIGYSKLLIEEAVERHLGRFIPAFRQIHEADGELLALIENSPDSCIGSNASAEGDAFRASLRIIALGISRTLASLAKNPECAHRRTLVDFEAIDNAIEHLLELTGLQWASDQVSAI
jgi:hypothetical protein